MRLLLTQICFLCLIAGCASNQPAPPIENAFYCDVEEKRFFSQEEIDWRGEHAPWNLAKDYRTNLSWEREECDDFLLQLNLTPL